MLGFVIFVLLAFQPLSEAPISVEMTSPECASVQLASFHSCDFICDFLAAKYNWSQAMVANCHLNCLLGNGPCPLDPEDCDQPDEPDKSDPFV